MRLVVDASIIFSMLIKKGFSYRLLSSLKSAGFELYSPVWVKEELGKDRDMLLKYSGLEESKLDFFTETVLGKMTVVSAGEYKEHLPLAKSIAPHPEDAPYFALAIAKSCPLWANEKAFKKQSTVKVLTTIEVEWLLQ